MTAKEMFENKGYKLIKDTMQHGNKTSEKEIIYTKKRFNGGCNYTFNVRFNNWYNTIYFESENPDMFNGEVNVYESDIRLLKAIQKQIEELGWE